MQIFVSVLTLTIIINTLVSVFVVMRTPRDIAATWAWLLVLILLPVLGLILYMFFGRGMSKSKLNRIQHTYSKGIGSALNQQRAIITKQKHKFPPDIEQLVNLFFNLNSSPVLTSSRPKIMTNSQDFFSELFKQIETAQKSIYVEFYTIYADQVGHKFRDALIKKAKQGVKVYVIYDGWGSMGVGRRFWAPLRAAGGHVELFFSSRYVIADFRLNYRNHRKIVVVDEKYGLIGGFNVGDQYLGKKKKFGNWRDTHILVEGEAVRALMVRFIMDYNATVDQKNWLKYPQIISNNEIAHPVSRSNTYMQLVTSGPDERIDQIEMGLIKLISTAKKRIWLQTPYLVPSDSFSDAIVSATKSGIDVRIMIPSFPDHPFIYRATQFYAHYLHRIGVKIYIYNNGFLHTKTSVIDEMVSTVGSANLDVRSFKLNFEATEFIYGKKFNEELAKTFLDDIENCTRLNDEMIKQQSWWLHFKQDFSRLLSPIL
ncbi:cardiolipin synthase [Xylocopilactobacillus apicola]|uniref:Cardiolipin synthase n=1 Tax=Xylocopilactobacillus apicola TaxID=2932184 RepID=A0AAU9DRL8_9LACO|nr:cardiolipin synthase [Xylocopilactobacillus apicola]BDR58609.1 cardiolipin synthase [Xylocopilactobacillus apicola]